jgi:hypothetical protein
VRCDVILVQGAVSIPLDVLVSEIWLGLSSYVSIGSCVCNLYIFDVV